MAARNEVNLDRAVEKLFGGHENAYQKATVANSWVPTGVTTAYAPAETYNAAALTSSLGTR